ncbi:MAG: DUF1122 family protein [Methanobacteriota archaeon]
MDVRARLARLEGASFGSDRVVIRRFEATKLAGRFVFDLALDSRPRPFLTGLWFEGSGNVAPWFEVTYDVPAGASHEDVLARLLRLLPPGGRAQVVYANHPETARALILGAPPPATEIGYALWAGGCRAFKDWYFPEGGSEGSEKLQGEIPLAATRARELERASSEELRRFVAEPHSETAVLACRSRAERILASLAASGL